MHIISRVVRFSALAMVALIFTACGGDESSSQTSTKDDRLRVVTTVSPITNIVENVGGLRIHLEGVVPEGVNSHTFEATPSMAKLISQADLIILNGLFLEQPTLALAESNKKEEAVILSLGEKTVSPEELSLIHI